MCQKVATPIPSNNSTRIRGEKLANFQRFMKQRKTRLTKEAPLNTKS